MRATAETVLRLAEASLSVMDSEIGERDQAAFRDELRKHVEAMETLGVGLAAEATCQFTSIYITCTGTATAERPAPGPAAEGTATDATTSARLAALGPIRWGPIRWGGGSCIPIPGTRCFLCYEYECQR